MLYSQDDYIKINKLRKSLWLKILVATLVFIAIVVICSIVRVDWPGYAAAVLWGITVVFLWGMQGVRIRRYYLYLKDIREGLEKTTTGSVQLVDKSVTTRDLVDFYTIIFNDDEANPESPARRLYFDASKDMPDFTPGEKLKVTLFGNNIKGFERI
jgi:hypothetical protein